MLAAAVLEPIMPVKLPPRLFELLSLTVFACCGCQSMSHKQQQKLIDARRHSGMGFQKIHNELIRMVGRLTVLASDTHKYYLVGDI